MSEHAAAFPLPGSSTPERDALLGAGRLTGLGELVRGFAHELDNPGGDLIALMSVSAGASFVPRLPSAGAAE
jgi:C4-dicarboxylate-specific signal transduction histidine kinase